MDATAAHPRRWFILVVMGLCLVLVVLDNTIVIVAIPTIAREVEATASETQWIVDSYLLVFGALLLTMGAVGDRWGRRGALQSGLGIVAAASIAVLWAQGATWLIVLRVAMGVGAALVMPATLSIITVVFPSKERGLAISIWAGLAGVGAALGLLAGGYLLENFDWQSVFLVNVPVALLAVVLVALVVPTSRDPVRTPLDVPGTLLSIVALTSTLYAVIEMPSLGLASRQVLSAIVTAIFAWPAFLLWETRSSHPMLPLGLFKDRGFSSGNSIIAIVFLAMFGVFFLLGQYFQFIRDYGPFETGLRFLPIIAGMGLGAPMADMLTRRLGLRQVVGAGLVIAAISMSAFALVARDSPYLHVALAFAGLGFGMALVMAPSTTLVMNGVPQSKLGVGSAMNDSTREIGGALGIAILGSLLNGVYRAKVVMPDALPATVREVAKDSIPAALFIADAIGGETGAALRESAISAFLDGFRVTALTAALILAGTMVVLFFMPRGVDEPGRGARVELNIVKAEGHRFTPVARRTFTLLTLGVLLSGTVLAQSVIIAPNADAPSLGGFGSAPPELQKATFHGEVIAVNGLPVGDVELAPNVHELRPNLTSGHTMAMLHWIEAPGGATTLNVHVEMETDGKWVLLANASGAPGVTAITPVTNFTGALRFLVSSNQSGPVDQKYALVALVAPPEVPLPPPENATERAP